MEFKEFAENLLGSRVKIKIVRYLLSSGAIVSERELAQRLGVSHTSVIRALGELHDLNLVSPQRIGRSTVWNVNQNSYALDFLKHFPEKIKYSALEELKTRIRTQFGTNPKIRKIMIFGSVAEGRELPNSDIDLFILVNEKRDVEDLKQRLYNSSNIFMSLYGNLVSFHVFSVAESRSKRNASFLDSVNRGITVVDK